MPEPQFDEELGLDAFVLQLVGAGSVCWTVTGPEWVFDDGRALRLSAAGTAWLQRYIERQQLAATDTPREWIESWQAEA